MPSRGARRGPDEGDRGARALGQHFLADPVAVARLLAVARIREGETVLEVGAGGGALTRGLAAAVGPAGHVFALELDPGLAATLRASALPGVAVIEGDALQVPLPARIDAVVANPPFRIAAPLLLRLLAHGFERAILVLPRELADRIAAPPGTERYGRLTVQVALAAEARLLFPVARRAFDPRPRVPCAVVALAPRTPPGLDAGLLDRVLAAAWASRSRTLRHALAPLATTLRLPSDALAALLRDRGWAPKRPAELAPPEYAALASEMARLAAPRARKGVAAADRSGAPIRDGG